MMLYMMTLPKHWFSYSKTNNLASPSCIPSWGYTWWQCQDVYLGPKSVTVSGPGAQIGYRFGASASYCENLAFHIGKPTIWHGYHVSQLEAIHDDDAKMSIFLLWNQHFRIVIMSVIMMLYLMILLKRWFSYRKTNNLARPSCLPTWGYTWWQCQNVYFTL